MTARRRALAASLVVSLVASGRPASAGFGVAATASAAIGTATLASPTSPSAGRAGCVAAVATSITVSWVKSSLATGYQVRYGTTNGGPYGTTAVAAGGSTAARTITGLGFSTTYYAVVVATVGGWTSAPTSQTSVTTPNVLCI